MTNSHHSNPTTPNTTPETPLTPTLFQQIQSLFLLKNTPLHTLYTQFQLSLTVLCSILHDKSTQALRRAIDEHTYLCAQRAHLELILETENVAIALARTDNPTQEQRRRLGTLNATLKTSFKHLQQLRGTLLNDDHTTDHTDLGEPHTTPKPTHTKRTTPRRAPTRATTNTDTAPTPSTPTPPIPNTQSTYSNTSNTNPNTISHTNTTPFNTTPTQNSPTHTTPRIDTTHQELAQDPTWLQVHALLSPAGRYLAENLPPEDLSKLLADAPPHITAKSLEYTIAQHPELLPPHLQNHLQPAPT